MLVSSTIPSNLSVPDKFFFKLMDFFFFLNKTQYINARWQIPVPYNKLHLPPTNYHSLAAQQEPHTQKAYLLMIMIAHTSDQA